jgi:hypothetical protein
LFELLWEEFIETFFDANGNEAEEEEDDVFQEFFGVQFVPLKHV